jgi:hypothetical protein
VVLEVAEHLGQLVGVRVVHVDDLHAELAQLVLKVEAVAHVPAEPAQVAHEHNVGQAGAAEGEQPIKVRA